MCFFTVPSETPARRAISLLVSPAAIATTMSRCRRVSGSAGRILRRSQQPARQPAKTPHSNAAVRSTLTERPRLDRP